MSKNKKLQATLDFLLTYGWIIMVVIAAISAILYFGVILNLPEEDCVYIVSKDIPLRYECEDIFGGYVKAEYSESGSYSEVWDRNLHIYYCDDFMGCDWLDCDFEKNYFGTPDCLLHLFEIDNYPTYQNCSITKYDTIFVRYIE